MRHGRVRRVAVLRKSAPAERVCGVAHLSMKTSLEVPVVHAPLLRRGLVLEYITLGWNVVGVVIVVSAALCIMASGKRFMRCARVRRATEALRKDR